MRTTIRLLVAAFIVAYGLNGGAVAQWMPPTLLPDCGGIYDLCGYRDRRTKALVIAQKFERTMFFSEGVAAVRVNGKYGYIDERGELIVQPKFDLAGGFYQGLAEVLVGNKTGVINRRGEIVIEPRFSRSIPFTADVVLALEGQWQNVHIRDREQLLNLAEPGLGLHNGFGLYHIRDGWITKPQYLLSIFETGGRGLIWATTGRDGPYGLLRANGTWQVEPQYVGVQRLSDERAIVSKPDPLDLSPRRRPLAGAVDPDGNLVVPLKSWWLSYWSNGFALVRESEDKQGLLDKAGNLIGGRYFEKAERAEIGDVGRVLIDGKWAGLDRYGQLVTNQDGGPVVASCPTGVKIVKKHSGYQVFGANGQPTTPLIFDYVPYFAFSCDGPNAVRLGEAFKPGVAWSFLGGDGRLLFDPPPFLGIYEFSNGHAIVNRGGKWGIINARGHFTVEPEFDKLQPAGEQIGSNGNGVYVTMSRRDAPTVSPPLYEGTKAGRSLVISATGDERPAPSKPDPRSEFLKCGGGAVMIARRGLFGIREVWGIAGQDGSEIIPPQYRAIHCFNQGIAWVPIDAKRQWCAIGPDGAVRAAPACVPSRYPYYQTHSFPERFSDDPYENSVLWSRAFLEFGAGKRSAPPRMIGDGGNGGTSSFHR